MRLSQEFKIASELREKVHLAEDQLRNEKKNLIKAQAHFSEEKEKWSAEIREKESQISSNEAEIKEKEAKYKEIKDTCSEVCQRTAQIEEENEALRKELQKLKLQKDDDMCKYLVEEGNLELELVKIEEWRKEVKVSEKWKKALQRGGPGERISSYRKDLSSPGPDKEERQSVTTDRGMMAGEQDVMDKLGHEMEEQREEVLERVTKEEFEKDIQSDTEKMVEKVMAEGKPKERRKKKEETKEIDEAFLDKLQ